jgi:hypothetical protein
VKVHFQFSTADLAEVTGRTVNRSPLIRRWRRRNSVAGALFLGLLAFALVPGDMTERAIAAFFVALVMAVVFVLLTAQVRGNSRTQAFYRERLGGDGPFECEVELTSDGVVSRQLGQELRHAWAQVTSVSEVPGGIEFLYRPIGSLLVRDRAFPDPNTRAEFLSLARGFVPPGSTVAPSPPAVGLPPVAGQATVGVPSEREYFVTWLAFFVCVSIAAAVVSAAIGAGAAAILRIPAIASRYAVYVFAGISFIATMCLSYLIFRFFVRRLVSRVHTRLVAAQDRAVPPLSDSAD